MTYQELEKYKKYLIDYIKCFKDYNDLIWFLEGVTVQAKIYPNKDEG